MNCIIWKRNRNGSLEKLATQVVADTSPTPEQAAWSAYSRTAALEPGSYAVTRDGIAVEVTTKRSQVATTLPGALSAQV